MGKYRVLLKCPSEEAMKKGFGRPLSSSTKLFESIQQHCLQRIPSLGGVPQDQNLKHSTTSGKTNSNLVYSGNPAFSNNPLTSSAKAGLEMLCKETARTRSADLLALVSTCLKDRNTQRSVRSVWSVV
jgi:hypothetical protein